jgi:hypothetical protein
MQQLFVTENIGMVQFDHFLHRRTIEAAQVTAVGDGKAQIGYLAAKVVLHNRFRLYNDIMLLMI